MPVLTAVRVVLVEPHYAGNLGSVARAMANFGPRDLVLVRPHARPDDAEAERLATHGQDILASARIVADLSEALAGCRFTAATSANKAGLYREQAFGWPDDVMPRLAGVLEHGPAALVFGPEPSGLTNAEVSACDALIHIPSDPEFPALNLAQAVTVCLYELRRCVLRNLTTHRPQPPAPAEDRQRMYAHLKRALEAVHFLYGPKTDLLMYGLRRLLDRAGPTRREVKILHGLARQLEWTARRLDAKAD